jgi:hypothetical protein
MSRPRIREALSWLDYHAQVRQQGESMTRNLHLTEWSEDGRFGRYLLRDKTWRGYLWIEIITVRNGVLVHGDCQTVLFEGFGDLLSPRGPIYWQARDNPQYGAEKARADDEWDARVARAGLLEHRRQGSLRDCSREDVRRLYEELDGENQGEFEELLYEVTSDSELFSIGRVVARRVIHAQAALCRLVQEFDRIEVQEKSAAWFARKAAA